VKDLKAHWVNKLCNNFNKPTIDALRLSVKFNFKLMLLFAVHYLERKREKTTSAPELMMIIFLMWVEESCLTIMLMVFLPAVLVLGMLPLLLLLTLLLTLLRLL
jgi:hypothetical protein